MDDSTADNKSAIVVAFYSLSAVALSLSLFVMAVSSFGLVLGNTLVVSANVQQTVHYNENVAELRRRFVQVLTALCASVLAVCGAAVVAIWVVIRECGGCP